MSSEHWSIPQDEIEAIAEQFFRSPTNMAKEIARLRAGLMRVLQYDNKCDDTGRACCAPERCSCHLEANTWLETH
jgi:hypothetical protein